MISKIISNVMHFMNKCKEDKINAYSAQTAFFIILSAIPFLMVFFSLLRYTAITEGVILNMIRQLMPEYISPFLVSVIDEVYHRSTGIISVTAVAAVWSASKGIHCIADGLNVVNGLKETRNWFVLRFWAVIYTVVFLVAIVFVLVVLVFGNSLHDLAVRQVPFLMGISELLGHFRGLWMLAILTLFFDIVFKALPNRKLSLKSQLPGAFICSVAWYVFSFGLSIYVDFFNGFSMYGSLTTIVLVMLWVYFCMYIMMLSAEVNVVFNRQIREFIRKHRKNKDS